MKPKDVGKSYDLIADRWASGDFSMENGIAQHRRAIAFASGRGKALDIGCGSSGRLLELMIESGFDPEGLDISQRMLELAKQRHPAVTFHQADICEWQFPKQYDFISAWDSIWHIPLQLQERVMSKVLAGLSPGGVIIFTTGGVDEPSETNDSAMGPPMYHSAPGIPKIMEILAEAGCVCRHLEYDQHPDLHVFVIAQRPVKNP
ncbi:MAG: class I SAM-dependent methyltransferase [Gammaproteobacteria bacterium]|nr:class I SAM-dependent methyltransferase [Gammaproteobacteria bacterium]